MTLKLPAHSLADGRLEGVGHGIDYVRCARCCCLFAMALGVRITTWPESQALKKLS